MRSLLELLSARQPLLLILDDLQWADAGSVELLGSLLRRAPDKPVLLAVGIRAHQTRARLTSTLDRAYRLGRLARHVLEPLTREDAEALLAETVPPAARDELFELSGGNPFYLEQLARSLPGLSRRASASPSSAPLTPTDIPPLVASALTHELERLSPDTRALLDGAAVAGDPFDLELAGAAAASSEPVLLDALDELLRLDIVRQTDAPRRFRFRHPLIRHVVYVSTPPGWRLAAHERCARLLTATNAPVLARAQHVERSARDGDLTAVATLRDAGRTAALRSPEEAAHWFGGALRLLPANTDPAVRVELLLARADSLRATGRFAESHSALIESLAVLPHDRVSLRVELTIACARLEQHLGLHGDARTRLERALVDLEDPDSEQAVDLMIALAVNGMHALNSEEQLAWAGRAVSAATPLQDPALRAEALALSAWPSERADAATPRQADAAAALLDGLHDDEVARRLDALAYLAGAEFYLDRFETAAGHAQRALDIARATGQNDLFVSVHWTLANALWLQGKLGEATEILDDAVEGARLLDNPQSLAWNLANRSATASAAGDVPIALATAEEASELAQSLDHGVLSVVAAVALARPLLETGRAAEAADLMIEVGGGVELPALPPHNNKARHLELLTRCFLRAGRRPEDAERSAAAAETSNPLGMPTGSALAHLAAAAIDLEHGDADSRGRTSTAGCRARGSVGDRFDTARAQLVAGVALARAGDEERAGDALEEAATAFESFGSPRYRAEAIRELRKLGRRVHRRTQPGEPGAAGVGSLTGRELEIARLVVDRRTNAEIAAQLFLTEKTIEAHLRNSFRKVGVKNRVELARAVEYADQNEPRHIGPSSDRQRRRLLGARTITDVCRAAAASRGHRHSLVRGGQRGSAAGISGGWRTRWRTSTKLPANERFRESLENRYGSLGSSRVQIPPSPLK